MHGVVRDHHDVWEVVVILDDVAESHVVVLPDVREMLAPRVFHGMGLAEEAHTQVGDRIEHGTNPSRVLLVGCNNRFDAYP